MLWRRVFAWCALNAATEAVLSCPLRPGSQPLCITFDAAYLHSSADQDLFGGGSSAFWWGIAATQGRRDGMVRARCAVVLADTRCNRLQTPCRQGPRCFSLRLRTRPGAANASRPGGTLLGATAKFPAPLHPRQLAFFCMYVQEDAHAVDLAIDPSQPAALFAVFDGHAGREVAAFCARHIVGAGAATAERGAGRGRRARRRTHPHCRPAK